VLLGKRCEYIKIIKKYF